tara:strand:+ start:190 stop:345 length:156 start_codon:yes stop_codon:yes gene_type:complete
MTDVERLIFLVEEIGILKTKIREHDTGHIHTAINVLEHRVNEMKEKLFNES